VNPFETTSITVPYQTRCHDRVSVIPFADGVVLAVADGAGGTGAGEQAAETVIRELTASASLDHTSESWCRVLRQIDCRIGAGESTGVVLSVSRQGLVGASVGDSQAWFIVQDELVNLTTRQVRKPLLGSGSADPVGFTHPTSQGLLLVMSDGFGNYVQREKLLTEIHWLDFVTLASKLVEMVRLPSGELWDDVGLIACRPRRTSQRQRYTLTDE
jgi:serine/threonine protein phosphatase PrpC